jgi:hypothetical protein
VVLAATDWQPAMTPPPIIPLHEGYHL